MCSQKLEVPSSLSVIDLPLGEILAKNFPLSFPHSGNPEKTNRSYIKGKQQQFNKCDENQIKEQTLSTHKVIVDLSGEPGGSKTVEKDQYCGSSDFHQEHSQFKPQSYATSGSESVQRSYASSAQRSRIKFPNHSQHSTRCVESADVSRQRTHANQPKSGVLNNALSSKSSQQNSIQRNTRSIIMKRRGLDLHCFVCNQVFETYRQVGEHCRMHNLKQQCPVCKAKFSASSNMKRHCLAHFSHTLYPCSFCKATFRRKDNLRTHMLRHIHKNNKKNETLHENSDQNQNEGHLSESICPRESEKDASSELAGAENMESTDHISLDSVDVVNVPIKQEKEIEDMMTIKDIQNQEPLVNPHENMMNECSSDPQEKTEEDNTPRNRERIVNYNCSSCGLEFYDMQSIRKHVIRYHAEQFNPGTSVEENQYSSHDQSIYQAPDMVLSLPTQQSENRKSNVFEVSDSPMMANKISFSNQSYDHSEVIDIEKLSQVSNSGDTSQSTGSSEQSSISGIDLSNEAVSLNESASYSSQPKRNLLGYTALMCSICKQYLHSGHAIMEHQTMHVNIMENKLQCVACGAQFSSKDCLRRHINNHIGNRFKCPLCSNVYSRKDNLKKHVKDVHQYHYDKTGSIRPLLHFQE